jgi:DNA sulfur modification protein DndD
MLLTKVTLSNYGVYRDKNEFDFRCDLDKPVILCGGTNGAGKTTLFESILLCLYGISFFFPRTHDIVFELVFFQKMKFRISKVR